MSKRWTERELSLLELQWGVETVEHIAKVLKKTKSAVWVMAFKKNLGGLFKATSSLMVNDIVDILGSNRKTVIKNIRERELKGTYTKLHEKEVYLVSYEDFITWLETNPNLWNAAKADKDTLFLLGIDKDFFDKKFKDDYKKIITEEDRKKIINLYNRGFSYQDICDKLNKKYSAVQWAINSLAADKIITLKRNNKGQLVRSSKRKNYGWTKEQDKCLVSLYREGYTLKEISVKVGKSLSATKTRNQLLTKRLMKNIPI